MERLKKTSKIEKSGVITIEFGFNYFSNDFGAIDNNWIVKIVELSSKQYEIQFNTVLRPLAGVNLGWSDESIYEIIIIIAIKGNNDKLNEKKTIRWHNISQFCFSIRKNNLL